MRAAAETTRATAGIMKWAGVLAAAGLLCACGSADQPPGRAGGPRPGSAAANVSATAAEVAEAARGELDCPPRIRSPKRDARAPVDDVVGVRPGMTYDEAASVVMCTHRLMIVTPESGRGFRMETYGHTVRQGFSARLAEPKVQKTSRQIMAEMQDRALARGSNRVVRDMEPGQAKWYVGAMGLPGQERVISAAREEWFEEGRNPTLASVEQALLEKYGTPTEKYGTPTGTRQPNGRKTLRWSYDPLGRLITEGSPLFSRCSGTADPDGASNFTPDCGIVVAAVIQPLPDNPDVAQFMQVGVVDKAGGYEALAATEQGLLALEQQRRAKETAAAAKNARAPTL